MDRRNNWKEDVGKKARQRAETRQALFVRKETFSRQLRELTVDEIKSDTYQKLVDLRAEVIAQLASM